MFSHALPYSCNQMLLFQNNLIRKDYGFPDMAKIKCTICTLLGYYAAYSDNCSPTFRCNLSIPGPIGTQKPGIAQNLMSSLRS